MNEKRFFSEALKDWRKNKELTQKDVADKIGLTRTIISFLENGLQKPQLHHLNLLKEKFNVDFFDTVLDLPQSEQNHFGPPRESDLSTATFVEMYNTLKEVKKDLIQVNNLLDELFKSYDDTPFEVIKGLKVIQKVVGDSIKKF
jgi:transcriptional regulator with XRE-family HTH domain